MFAEVIRDHTYSVKILRESEDEWAHSFNPQRIRYKRWNYIRAKIDILSGWEDPSSLYDFNHPFRGQPIGEYEQAHIAKYVPRTNDWRWLRKQIKERRCTDPNGYQPPLTRYFMWIANLHGRKTEIPNCVYGFMEAICPYYKKIMCVECILICCLQELGLEWRWIPAAPVKATQRKVREHLLELCEDYDFSRGKFDYSIHLMQMSKVQLKKYKNMPRYGRPIKNDFLLVTTRDDSPTISLRD